MVEPKCLQNVDDDGTRLMTLHAVQQPRSLRIPAGQLSSLVALRFPRTKWEPASSRKTPLDSLAFCAADWRAAGHLCQLTTASFANTRVLPKNENVENSNLNSTSAKQLVLELNAGKRKAAACRYPRPPGCGHRPLARDWNDASPRSKPLTRWRARQLPVSWRTPGASEPPKRRDGKEDDARKRTKLGKVACAAASGLLAEAGGLRAAEATRLTAKRGERCVARTVRGN